jgi:hypothetical protein
MSLRTPNFLPSNDLFVNPKLPAVPERSALRWMQSQKRLAPLAMRGCAVAAGASSRRTSAAGRLHGPGPLRRRITLARGREKGRLGPARQRRVEIALPHGLRRDREGSL